MDICEPFRTMQSFANLITLNPDPPYGMIVINPPGSEDSKGRHALMGVRGVALCLVNLPTVRRASLRNGGVSERPKVRVSKAREGESSPWVQIPPPPPTYLFNVKKSSSCCLHSSSRTPPITSILCGNLPSRTTSNMLPAAP